MINSYLVEFTYVKIKDIRSGRKVYAPGYKVQGSIVKAKVTRYKQASQALQHSRLFHQDWCIRYDAIIAAMAQEPAA